MSGESLGCCRINPELVAGVPLMLQQPSTYWLFAAYVKLSVHLRGKATVFRKEKVISMEQAFTPL